MTASGEFDARPVRAFLPGPDLRVDESAWPASVPALAQVLRHGLELPAGLTVLVGENGSGKSTVVETLAEAYGLNPQGGSALGQSFRIRESEPGVGGDLIVVRGVRPRWSYFLRADTMHQLYTYLEQNPGKSDDPWHQLSHGEGIPGDPPHPGEPDRLLPDGRAGRAAVVHVASLGLAALLHDLATAGSQLVVATHSPVLAAVPGANLLELGPWGIRPASWEDLSLVVAWRQFMRDPQAFFRHLFEA